MREPIQLELARPCSPRPDDRPDVDDTAECPLATACESCGTTDDLAVATAAPVGVGAGVFCLTLCGRCVPRPLPTMSPLDALTRVGRHAEHLGLDLDSMAALLDLEDGDR